MRDLESLKGEAADTVADMMTASQEKEIADALTGIAKNESAEELQRMRQLRQEVKAEVKISKELAGTDTKAQEAEFLEFARTTGANDEFDALAGLSEEKDKASKVKKRAKKSQEKKLPE
ncbi:hypothetical protein ACFLU6_01200 [Acidobacteriota bacterium]